MDMIGNDILDIGSKKNSYGGCRQPRAMAFGPTDGLPKEGIPGQFDIPSVADPALYCRSNFASVCGGGDEDQMVKFAKGTTTLAFKFNDGIIVSVDSRSTQGNYIASQSVQKVIRINPYLLGTMAGGAADCMFWQRNLGMQCRLYELRNNRRISVASASKLLANVMTSYRGYGLSMGTMVTGWDDFLPRIRFEHGNHGNGLG